MNHIRLIKSRKAISPILATLLLIVIAVAAIIVTYAWIMTYMSGTTTQAGVMLIKENVRFYGVPDTAKNRTDITIKNTGTSDATIKTLYIGLSKADRDITTFTNIGNGIVLAKNGGKTTITLTWPNDFENVWQPGTVYYFKITTTGTYQFEFTETTQAT